MIRTLLTVLGKEFMETVRDRRSLLSSLVLTPLFGPLLFAGGLSLSMNRAITSLDDAIPLAVAGADHAPNLVHFLRQRGFTLTLQDADDAGLRAWIAEDVERVVLVVPEAFGTELAAGEPARLQLYADASNSRAERYARRTEQALHEWSSILASLRLQARGISPLVVQPLVVDQVDLSTPTTRSTLVLGMLSYLIVLATLLGGMYLAIDATAGERERGSLESLLTLPVPRAHLIYGKVLASALFMTIALVLVIITSSQAITYIPLEEIGMSANFGPAIALGVFVSMLPFTLLGAALLTVVASFTRSYKEAQTWLGAVLVVPTMPILVAGLLDVKANAGLMLIPSMSQHLLIQGLLRGEPLSAGFLAISSFSTLALGLLLTLLASWLYQRERILG
ncbi:MAG: ABC transporter permease [Steroidobacteraceae bacterium]|jgi:sodium transport system permease protein